LEKVGEGGRRLEKVGEGGRRWRRWKQPFFLTAVQQSTVNSFGTQKRRVPKEERHASM
jgi:hypothetical protein